MLTKRDIMSKIERWLGAAGNEGTCPWGCACDCALNAHLCNQMFPEIHCSEKTKCPCSQLGYENVRTRAELVLLGETEALVGKQ